MIDPVGALYRAARFVTRWAGPTFTDLPGFDHMIRDTRYFRTPHHRFERVGSWALTGTSPRTIQTVGSTRGAVTSSNDGDTIDVEIRQGGSQVHERGPGTRNLDAPRVWVLTMASWLDYKRKSARQGFYGRLVLTNLGALFARASTWRLLVRVLLSRYQE